MRSLADFCDQFCPEFWKSLKMESTGYWRKWRVLEGGIVPGMGRFEGLWNVVGSTESNLPVQSTITNMSMNKTGKCKVIVSCFMKII